MASQPSSYNEERNLLRMQAWEQRNQETIQAKEAKPQNVPLFGEPYKTNKGDELSSRIQRMLGSYEDVNHPYRGLDSLATEPYTHIALPQSHQGPPHSAKSSKPPFCNQVHHMSSQNLRGPSHSNSSSQPVIGSAVSSTPNHSGHSSLNDGRISHSVHQQKKAEALPKLSANAEQHPSLHSSEQNNRDPKSTDGNTDGHKNQEFTGHRSECGTINDTITLDPQLAHKDLSLSQANKGNSLPSQTFPPLLCSKVPTIVMTQKPTAYVRPMDGQDQVISESPDLKPSPEPYTHLPEVITNKPNLDKMKMLPEILETGTNEAQQCVEDILREMTHSWPPVLTAIRTPSADEPSKSTLLPKEAECLSSAFTEKKKCNSYTDSSGIGLQSFSSLPEPVHSSGGDSASSGGSGSSSRSESDSEGPAVEPQLPPVSNSTNSKRDDPAVVCGDWQLGNWIKFSQQNSSTESQATADASDIPSYKQLLSSQSFQHATADLVNPTPESKPQLSSHQKQMSGDLSEPQQHSENSQIIPGQGKSSQFLCKDVNSCTLTTKTSENTHPSKPAKIPFSDHSVAAHSVQCEDVLAPQDKDSCFTDGPKVKTKTRRDKKSNESSDCKTHSKSTTKHRSRNRWKVGSEPGSEVSLVLYGHCSSCGVRFPSSCSCVTQQDQLSPAPPVRVSCSNTKKETVNQKDIKTPKGLQPATHSLPAKAEHKAQVPKDLHRITGSLLVKINLSLLSRVPQISGLHQEISSKVKQPAFVVDKEGGGSEAQTTKLVKTCKKNRPIKNVEIDCKALPRKKQRLENLTKNYLPADASTQPQNSRNPKEDWGRNKVKKKHGHLQQSLKEAVKESKPHKRCSDEMRESSKVVAKSRDGHKHKKSSTKHSGHSKPEKKPPKSMDAIPSSSQPTRDAGNKRPLLRIEDRQYPVKHYIKEAKRLKHKADAESDKLSKAFNYLDAAMYFVESGIAMEKDPQISMSSYTMFAETVELLKFVVKLKNPVDPSAPPSEKDFLVLCMKCQSLLQMAMFQYKQKTARTCSKTLTEHFINSSQTTHDPSACLLKGFNTSSVTSSPANTPTCSGPGSGHCEGGGGTVTVPRAIEQMALVYVNITSLILSAHDVWEQAEELAHKGSGMLAELDTVMGPLTLTSSMNSMIRYTRQGVHWLRLDSQKALLLRLLLYLLVCVCVFVH
ncbi:AF4/FMR2 family member 1 isoform X2 [Thalassophryne amazonica]|uniref:AF4/FMR2 family member 1 isoform X2 n=1 Tax=Thalassophryne amazonica TaxID=390379 RepID=UPI001471D479|nr:AF4/FMR2 family member 1 isoform X2 [Thalassophryne amazonica]